MPVGVAVGSRIGKACIPHEHLPHESLLDLVHERAEFGDISTPFPTNHCLTWCTSALSLETSPPHHCQMPRPAPLLLTQEKSDEVPPSPETQPGPCRIQAGLLTPQTPSTLRR